jgi:hypothetical protein
MSRAATEAAKETAEGAEAAPEAAS